MKSMDEYRAEFAELESGIPRLNGIRSAITEADANNELYLQFMLRFSYIKESIFCGDRYFAMIVFPQLMALYDEHEQLRQNQECDYNMLVAFKWIVEAAPEFPQISKSEIDGYFRMFKRRLLEHGCSLSIYHMKRSLFYLHCDRSIAAAEFYRFLDAPLDYISDGRALYYDQQVIYYTFIGDEQKALKAAQPIFSGEMTSNALPQATRHCFIRYYLNIGDYQNALIHAADTLRRVDKDPYYLDIIGSLLALYGMTKPYEALRIFCRNYPVYAQSKNPYMQMQFAIGAFHLFRTLPETCVLPENCSMPGETLPHSIPELKTHFYHAARTLAEKFDARNGTPDFITLLHYEYPPYYTEN